MYIINYFKTPTSILTSGCAHLLFDSTICRMQNKQKKTKKKTKKKTPGICASFSATHVIVSAKKDLAT